MVNIKRNDNKQTSGKSARKNPRRGHQTLSASQPSLTQGGWVEYLDDLGNRNKNVSILNVTKRTFVSQTTNRTSFSSVTPEKNVPNNNESFDPSPAPSPDINDAILHTQEDEGFVPSDIEQEEERLKEDVARYEQDLSVQQEDAPLESSKDIGGELDQKTEPKVKEDTDEEDENEEKDDDDYSYVEELGIIMTYHSPIGDLEYVTPLMEFINDENKGLSSYVKVTRPKFHQVFKNYGHLKDKGYIRCVHKIVNGCIAEWRKGIKDLTLKLDEIDHIKNRQSYRNQCKYAENTALFIQHSISQYDEFPVKILNKKWLKKMVECVNTDEDASFVFQMANSRCFELKAMKEKNSNEVNIITRFDDKRNMLFGYHG